MTTISIIDPRTEKTIQVEPISRDAYLTLRSKWRNDYAELSRNIRETKSAIREAQKALDGSEVSSLTMSHSILRDYATAAIEERRLMKLQAQASYLASREEARLAA